MSSEPQAESCHKEFSKAGRATSGHTSNAAAIGDKKAKKATKTMKRRDRDAEEVVELDRSSPAGSKQHTSRDAEQQGAKAKDPAGSRKLDRAVPQNQQRALDVGVRELKSAKLSHQTRATTEGKQDAMRDDDDDDDEAPEDDDAPEEVESSSEQQSPFSHRHFPNGYHVSTRDRFQSLSHLRCNQCSRKFKGSPARECWTFIYDCA